MAAQRTAADIVLKRFSTIDDALGALNRGEVDAVVGDEPLIAYSIKSFLNTIPLPGFVNRYKYAAVVRKGRTDLLAGINATIGRLESVGELKKLDKKWLGAARRDAINLRLRSPEAEGPKSKVLSADSSAR